MPNEKTIAQTAWNLDDLTADQRELLGEYLCSGGSGSYVFDDAAPKNVLERMMPAAESLAVVGLVTVETTDDDECVVGLTPAGEAWILTLSEGSLAG